ncbi:kinesin-19, putative [Plasmodium relictum]|uniref:Kinesin-19, putative n=1 Tax=Plasmodium relictum TaxID=85471 RepID=A0A1J1H266_PLARL|nr:kinesin-19, putative [Plasmodium relictum]CRG98646.1 kinesin-19, putative [Plasmodium relictum]
MDKQNEEQKCENLYSSDFFSADLINKKVEGLNHNYYDFNDTTRKCKIYDKSVTIEFESDYESSYKKNKYKEYSKQSTLSIDNNDVENATEYSFETKNFSDKQEMYYNQCEKTNENFKEKFQENEISTDKITENKRNKNEVNPDDANENEININKVNEDEVNVKEINENEINMKEINENEITVKEINESDITENEVNESKINENEINKNGIDSLKYADDLISNEANEKSTNILEGYEESSENNLDINWNKSQIKTCIRIKPSDSIETEFENAITQKGANKILINYGMKGENKKCEFLVDKVFNQGSTQLDVWKSICFCIDSIFYFKNATVFAHGHTGTGKTYTMIGPDIMEIIKKKKKKIRFAIKRIQQNDLLINTNSLKLLNNNSNSNSNNFFYDRKRSCSQPIFNLPPRIIPLVNANSTNYKKINDAYGVLNSRYNNKSNVEYINENNYAKYENYKTFSEYRNEYKYNARSIKDEIQLVLNSEKKGMIPRACEEIMKRLSLLKSSRNTEAYEENNIAENTKWEQNSTRECESDQKAKDIFKNVKVYASYMQLYNDRIFDLLNPYNESQPYLSTLKSNFTNNTTFVSGLLTVEVNSCEELIELLIDGTSNRACRITKTNEMSTRSHSIFKIELRNVNNSKPETFKSGNLLLIDLAGNEKYEASNEKLYTTEVCSINRSLSALSLCINELSKGNKSISYRNSILTRLLQGSLGGSSKTIFICTVSPSINNVRDTLSSLKLAAKAKKIQFQNKNYSSYMYEDIKKLKRELNFLKKFVFFQYITNKYESKKRLKKIKEFYFNNFPFIKNKIGFTKLNEHIEKYYHNNSDNVEGNAKLNGNEQKMSNDSIEQNINKNQEEINENELNQMINTYKGIENIYNDYEFTSFNSLLLQWNLNKSSIKKVKENVKIPSNKKYLWFNSNGNINKKSIINFIETHTIEYEIETDEDVHNKSKKNEKELDDEEDNYNVYDIGYEDLEVDNYNYCNDDYENIEGEMDEGETLDAEDDEKDEKKNKRNSNDCDEYIRSEVKLLKKKDELEESGPTEEQEEREEEEDEDECEDEEVKQLEEEYESEELEHRYEDNEEGNILKQKKIKNTYKEKRDIKKTKKEVSEIKRNKQIEENLNILKKTKHDVYMKDVIFDKKKNDYNKDKNKKKKKRSENYIINEHFENNKNFNESIKIPDSNKANYSLSTRLIRNKDNNYSNISKNKKKHMMEKNREKKNKRDNKNETISKLYNFNINKKKVFNSILKNRQEENNIKSVMEKKKEKLIKYMKIKKISNPSYKPNNNSYNSNNTDNKINAQESSLIKVKNEYRKKKYIELNKIHKSEYFLEGNNNKNKVSPENFTILSSLRSSKNFKNFVSNINSYDKTFSVNSIKSKKENNDLKKIQNNSVNLKCLEIKNLNQKNFVNNIGINNLVINKVRNFPNLTGYNYKTRTYEVIDNNNIYLNDEQNEDVSHCEFSKNSVGNDDINIEYDNLNYNMNDERGRSISENCCYNNLKNKTVIGKNYKGKFTYYIEFDKLNNMKKHTMDENFINSKINNRDSLYNCNYHEVQKFNKKNAEILDYKKKIGKNDLITEIEKSWLSFEKKLENKLKKKKLNKGMKIRGNSNINSNVSQVSALEENKKKLEILKNRYGKIFIDSQKTRDYLYDNVRTDNNNNNNNNNENNNENNKEYNKQINNEQSRQFNSNKSTPIHDEAKNIEKTYILNNDIIKDNFKNLTNTKNSMNNIQHFLFKDHNNMNSSTANCDKQNSSNSYYDVKKNNYLNNENCKTDIYKKLSKTDTIAQSYTYKNLKNEKLKNSLVRKENFNFIFDNNSTFRELNPLNTSSTDKQINSEKNFEIYGEIHNKLFYTKNYNNDDNSNNESHKITMSKCSNELNIKKQNSAKTSNNCTFNKDNKEKNINNKMYSTIFFGNNHSSNIYIDKKEDADTKEDKVKEKNEIRTIVEIGEIRKEEVKKTKKENEKKKKNSKMIEENKYMKISEKKMENINCNINKYCENNYIKAYHTDDLNLKKMQHCQLDNFKSRKMHKMDFFYMNDKNNNNNNTLNSEDIKLKKYNYIGETIIPHNNKVNYMNNVITYNNSNIKEKIKNIHYYSNDINHNYTFRNGIVSNKIDNNTIVNPLTLDGNTTNTGIINDINKQKKFKLIFENANEYETKMNNQVNSNEIKKRNTTPLDSYFHDNNRRGNAYNQINYVLDKTKINNCSITLDNNNKKMYLLNYNMKK